MGGPAAALKTERRIPACWPDSWALTVNAAQQTAAALRFVIGFAPAPLKATRLRLRRCSLAWSPSCGTKTQTLCGQSVGIQTVQTGVLVHSKLKLNDVNSKRCFRLFCFRLLLFGFVGKTFQNLIFHFGLLDESLSFW